MWVQGIEAGRPVRVRLHRWQTAEPKKKKKASVVEGEEEDAEATEDTRDPFEAGEIASPRQLARLVGDGCDQSLEVMDEVVVQADQEGFAMIKNLLVNGSDQSSMAFALVCNDSTAEQIAEVVSLAETLEIPVLLKRKPLAPPEE